MSTFTIAGKDFYQYVAYRLKKDGLGFLPASVWGEGCTDARSYIKAVVPKTSYDFLVYAHELGHCKSEQKLPPSGLMFAYDQTSSESLSNEYNAWVWAFRYLKKLGITYTKEEITSALQSSFKSYTRKAKYPKQANFYIEKLNKLLDINLSFEDVSKKSIKFENYTRTTISWGSLGDYFEPVWESKPVATPKLNKKHQPWMDLLDKKRKHSWKNKK